MWVQAAELRIWGTARHAFESGLGCDLKHLLLAEKLTEVLLHIKDYLCAAHLAAYVLKIHPSHPRASQLSICLRGLGQLPGLLYMHASMSNLLCQGLE